MTGTTTLTNEIVMTLQNRDTGDKLEVYIHVFADSLSKKWLAHLNELLDMNYHLEKNYQFFGFPDSPRDGEHLTAAMNKSIAAINKADLGYQIDDFFSMENTIQVGEVGEGLPGGKLIHEKLNWLHRYFEDLQGQAGHMSPYYLKADPETRWHIRQLNLLCHEYESWVLSLRKQAYAPEWMRPSQIMCFMQAPRFELTEEDYESFGIETLARPLGGVFVGVNKSVGKHHWEVFNDEGKDSRVGELVTSTLISQTMAAGDFDIEWANNPGNYDFFKQEMKDFRQWLINNGFDPNDKSLTIGHPQVGQVDLAGSFGTTDYELIWEHLYEFQDVFSIKTNDAYAEFPYHWSDVDFVERQIKAQEGYND